jgi:hypothetical protein
MAPFFQYGWLLLLLCAGIVLLLIGCATFGTRTPVHTTAAPLVTLTVVPFTTESPQPHSTLVATATQPTLPPPGWLTTRTSSSATQSDDAACYNNPNHGYTCLGQVANVGDETLTNIVVNVSLLDSGGKVLAEQIISVEQYYLHPNHTAPFRAQFEQFNSLSDIIRAEIYSNGITDLPQQPIEITGERGMLATNGRYVVTANLRNMSNHGVETIHLIVTVLDMDNHVVGYRVQVVEPMIAASERAVRVEVIPQVMETELHHLLHVEVIR